MIWSSYKAGIMLLLLEKEFNLSFILNMANHWKLLSEEIWIISLMFNMLKNSFCFPAENYLFKDKSRNKEGGGSCSNLDEVN